jgi:hypothetical protein
MRHVCATLSRDFETDCAAQSVAAMAIRLGCAFVAHGAFELDENDDEY